MIDLMKKILGIQSEGNNAADEKPHRHKLHIATCALLLEIAHIDGTFTEAESQRIVSALKDAYGLSDSEIADIMHTADHEVKKSIDLWRFTSLINQHYSSEEKVRIVEMIWKVIYADGSLDKYEDYLVHNLADLLYLDHSKLIEAKLKVKKDLAPE
jgi:uncharacterized tellurite resistance protein B-like protein